jgi:hypothetical protein
LKIIGSTKDNISDSGKEVEALDDNQVYRRNQNNKFGENRHGNSPTMNAEKVLNAPANPAIILITMDSSEVGLPDGTETT